MDPYQQTFNLSGGNKHRTTHTTGATGFTGIDTMRGTYKVPDRASELNNLGNSVRGNYAAKNYETISRSSINPDRYSATNRGNSDYGYFGSNYLTGRVEETRNFPTSRYSSTFTPVYYSDSFNRAPEGFYYHDTYKGPSSWRYATDIAKMPSRYSRLAPHWRLAEESYNYNRLREVDLATGVRYPYTTSYLYDRYGSNLYRQYDWWYNTFPHRSEYYDLIHRHGRYSTRLSPGYLSTYDKYNSASCYVPNPCADLGRYRSCNSSWTSCGSFYRDTCRCSNPCYYRRAYPQDFCSMRTSCGCSSLKHKRRTEDSFCMLPRSERLCILDRFYNNRIDDYRLRGYIGGSSYISPSNLYYSSPLRSNYWRSYNPGKIGLNKGLYQGDSYSYLNPYRIYSNPYRWRYWKYEYPSRLVSYIGMLNRELTSFLPIESTISSADELTHVLAEFILHDTEWRNIRDAYIGCHDFNPAEIQCLLPNTETLGEDDIIGFCRRLEIFPCQEELNEFFKRFGDRGVNSISKRDFLEVMLGGEGPVQRPWSTRHMGINTTLEISRFLRRLLSNLLKQKALKKRFFERRIDIESGFNTISKGTGFIDSNLLREALLRLGITTTNFDIESFLKEASGEKLPRVKLIDIKSLLSIN